MRGLLIRAKAQRKQQTEEMLIAITTKALVTESRKGMYRVYVWRPTAMQDCHQKGKKAEANMEIQARRTTTVSVHRLRERFKFPRVWRSKTTTQICMTILRRIALPMKRVPASNKHLPAALPLLLRICHPHQEEQCSPWLQRVTMKPKMKTISHVHHALVIQAMRNRKSQS